MSLTLTVDGERWRAHLRAVAAENPGLVPVAKGNGYGFTLGRLARKAQWLADQGLGTDTLAVGTYHELPEVASRFRGDLLVLTPWRSFGPGPGLSATDPALAKRVIHTVSRPEDLAALLDRDPDARFVLERLTSMVRHGMTARELRTAALLLEERGATHGMRGAALHLPLTASHLPEVHRLMNDVVAAGLATSTVWVSHLSPEELATLRTAYPETTFRPRIGTRLWLGDRGALSVTATVLDVHPVDRGEAFGYRGRTAPRAGHIVVVSGGTAHGIGLTAPTGDQSVRARASTLARGGLEALGFARSPYHLGGKAAVFAEPPHMQASMLFLPRRADVPAVGDPVPLQVRFTTTHFDVISIA